MTKPPAAKLLSPYQIREFFARSDWLDRMSLRPLSHIAPYWETSWDEVEQHYKPEPFSFADDLNKVIELISTCPRPQNYHDHEDALAENVIRSLKWPIQKKRGFWMGADYQSILEQGAFEDWSQKDLIAAAAGRVHTAIDHKQTHFDDMEIGHLNMLAALISIIIYHRYSDDPSVLMEVEESEH